MKQTRKKRTARGAARGGRYDIRAITAEIERQRIRLGLEVKVITDDLDMDQRGWYKKVLLKGSEFSLAEISAIADYMKSPPLWPFLAWEAAELLLSRGHNGGQSEGAAPRKSDR